MKKKRPSSLKEIADKRDAILMVLLKTPVKK